MNSINPLVTTYTSNLKTQTSLNETSGPEKNVPVDSGKLTFFSSAEETMQVMGRMVLGNERIAGWEAKGLKIDDKTIELAFEQMNLALKELGGKAGKISYNPHQIVKAAQDVPQWFEAEQQKTIAEIQDPVVKKRFQAGELFASTLSNNPSNQRSVDSYISVSGR